MKSSARSGLKSNFSEALRRAQTISCTPRFRAPTRRNTYHCRSNFTGTKDFPQTLPKLSPTLLWLGAKLRVGVSGKFRGMEASASYIFDRRHDARRSRREHTWAMPRETVFLCGVGPRILEWVLKRVAPRLGRGADLAHCRKCHIAKTLTPSNQLFRPLRIPICF